MADALTFKPIRELAGLIASKAVSPVELTQTYLERLERFGPHYNALVTLTAERALATARRAESEITNGRSLGLLHGIPWGAKDLLATSGGIPTTWGAAPFRDQQFDYDATVVARLEGSGAPLAGKLAMIELAGGMGYIHPDASLTGPPKNPWDTGRWTGGSSSGSGASVAAGLVPFAIGSETWGSILSPATNCGLAGLRPTYGRGQPVRGHGPLLDPGQAGAALFDRRRLRHSIGGNFRSGPAGPFHSPRTIRLSARLQSGPPLPCRSHQRRSRRSGRCSEGKF